MFWVIVAAVIVVGFAIAWWTSGRSKPRAAQPVDAQSELRNSEALAQSIRNRISGNGSGGAGGF